jgi:hypothetical protein
MSMNTSVHVVALEISILCNPNLWIRVINHDGRANFGGGNKLTSSGVGLFEGTISFGMSVSDVRCCRK